MVGWGAFEKALDKVGTHTNLVGKYWITTFNMLRKVVKICQTTTKHTKSQMSYL